MLRRKVRPAEELRDIFESDRGIDLARAAAALAKLEYPDLDFTPYVAEIDDYARAARRRLADRTKPESAISAINRVLFEELGFCGNRSDYYDPRNSFLNDVIERRTGIPISLSVLYIEIGRRLNLPIFGVGLPAHFLVKYDDGSRSIFIDPFHEGRVLNRQGCRDLLRTLHGRPVELTDLHFAAVDERHILLRMCTNLRRIYFASREYRKALAVIDAMLELAPESLEELKQRAWLQHELGKRAEALRDFELYAALNPDAADAGEVDQWISNIRRTLARLN